MLVADHMVCDPICKSVMDFEFKESPETPDIKMTNCV